MKNIKRLIRGKERGFTLIEVLIAVAITGIIAAGIIMALGTSTKMLIITDTRETAKDIAASDMEYIRSLQYNAISYPLPAPPSGYSTPNVIYPTFLRMNEQRIDITVSWGGNSFTLTDFRVNY